MLDDGITNADRAWWAFFALGDFVNRTGVHTAEEAIGDLLTDLLHLARVVDVDPSLLAKRALAAMAAEAEDDDEGDMAGVKAALEATMHTARGLALPWRH